MEGEKGRSGTYGVRTCPRCGAELYTDMHVCYGCLYDFSRDKTRSVPGMPELPGEDRDDGGGSSVREKAGDTRDLLAMPGVPVQGMEAPGVYVRTASADVWTPVLEEGLSVGRDDANQIVLHSPAVSRHHLRLRATPDGMEVTDLGSTNPATYRGREVTRSVVVSYGDAVDVCGCSLLMTGAPPG